MQHRLSTVERALELARGGTHSRVDDIRRQLTQEGFDNVSAHLSGSFARQLKQVMSSN